MTRDQLALQLRGVLAEETPPNVGDRRIQAMVDVVLDVVDDLVWSKTGTYTPDPDGGDDGTFVPDTWRKRADDLQVRLDRAQAFAAVLHDLDRCEHGRHEGDTCSSCGGPSAGNPIPLVAHLAMPNRTDDPPLTTLPRQLGYDLSARPIVVPEAHQLMTDPDAWRTR